MKHKHFEEYAFDKVEDAKYNRHTLYLVVLLVVVFTATVWFMSSNGIPMN